MRGLKRFLFVFLLFPLFWAFASCQQSSTTTVSGSPSISVYFSPRGGATSAIVSEIKRAEKSIDVAIYSFTSRKIARALIAAHKRGIRVRIVADEGSARSRNSVLPLLESAGIPVRYKRGSGGGLMHNKYAVVDGETVITGSFNWTVSAEKRNDENLLVIKGLPAVVKAYEENFEKLWELAGLTN
ncbi:phospholipase D family protein [Phorcysia thermohydrogeniphila]|uniref:phospholipase D n=1 Tax=Phorcysia thermohydrogeniphila TaxID=936138 RepID=A0A4R1GDR6_9BACT|nr:phospholipase D family protein [Phorcysia thermohydrogeniphila]TCK06497.1 phospholipase D-like protein [Phorcysia thermohydrogeniphila]